jgi:exodeoxyribonuclease V gamma subunit
VLHIHRAERADGLVDALSALLLDPLEDPFAPEILAVPTRGMERWLTQRLSEHLGATPERSDGVCANVVFPSPGRLVGEVVAAASGVQPEQDPWTPERAAWPLLEVVDECLREPWLRDLADYLGSDKEVDDPVRRGRRLTTVRRFAQLFDRYGLHRPEMVSAWADGRNIEGSGGELSANVEWQAELWRRLRARIGLASPAERREEACARLHKEAEILDLPERLSLFGLTRLPTGHVDVLSALSEHRDVHLFLLHPSSTLWEALADVTGTTPPPTARRDDQTAQLPSNPILASWGRDAREMQLVLSRAGGHADHHRDADYPCETLLQRIQADVRADRAPSGAPLPGDDDTRPQLEPADRSLQVHACHGRARQVEVVRDAILHLLAQDSSLEPRDIVVMCPDIETFAPLIHATFGAGERRPDAEEIEAPSGEPAVELRVRLADRSLRQTNPILAVVAELLELVGKRLTASQLLDLADREPVRRRFRLDDDDVARLQSWIGDAGIRWGLDAAHRAPFKLDRIHSGTWRAGLDRLLLGVTMTEDKQRLFESVLPLDDVDSRAIDLAGRFAELIARLEEALDSFGAAMPITAWTEAIGTAADSLTATSDREAWQRLELQRLLDDLVDEATLGDDVAATPLAPAEVSALLQDRLAGRPTRANFRTGHLTICTLVPMRSVPHRVVCLLGLDDGAFPRKAARDGEDLMLDDPHVGERDPRTEDRQLLLDALLAATEKLVITYTGNDERTNIPQPPAVPVGELLDVVDATARAEDTSARAQVVVHHPLQPFATRNFARGALVRDATWSFDPVMLDGARALSGHRSEPRPFLSAPLPELDTGVIEIQDLVRFVEHPVRAFLRTRLRLSLSEISDEVEDRLRVELDGLQLWGVGQRLLDARLAGVDARTAVLAEIARGTLPPSILGEPVVNQVYPTVDAIAAEAERLSDGGKQQDPIDVRVTLPDGARLGGTVAGVVGDALLTTSYSRVAAKHRLASWVRLLALVAADPERPFSAVTIGRADRNATLAIARLELPASDPEGRGHVALDHLASLIDLYRRGMREPLPLFCKTSAAYAGAAAAGRDPVAGARREWVSGWKYDKEDRELEHQLVLGGVRTLDDLLEATPRPGEGATGWEVGDATRLGRYARRLWDGLLACEELTTR